MTEQDSNEVPPSPQPGKSSLGKKLGIGAALVVLPIGAYELFTQVKNAEARKDKEMEQGAAYDLAALRRVDPSLVKYHEVGRIDTGMALPRAITVDAKGQLLVAGQNMLRAFSSTGQKVSEMALNGSPTAIATAADGTIFLAMKNRLELLSADGKLVATWSDFPQISYITCLAISGKDVYIADAGRRLVFRYSLDGKLLNKLAEKDDAQGIPGLIVPSPHMDVAVGPDGLVWIANPGRHQLEAYTPEGKLQRTWGKFGTGVAEFFGCCNPSDFALLADGSFVTAEKGMARVKLYRPDGHFDCVVAAPDAFAENMTGLDVASNAQGQVFVLEPGSASVRIFARSKGGQG